MGRFSSLSVIEVVTEEGIVVSEVIIEVVTEESTVVSEVVIE